MAMTNNLGNQLRNLLKRNETAWLNPEASIGVFYRQMGRMCCWEAVGPAREVFVQIADDIKLYLEKSSDPVSHTVTWTIYMIGRTMKLAKPTIMFCCQAPGPRKMVRKMIEESEILVKYPGIVTGDSTRPPDFDQLVQLAGTEEIVKVGLDVAKIGVTSEFSGLCSPHFGKSDIHTNVASSHPPKLNNMRRKAAEQLVKLGGLEEAQHLGLNIAKMGKSLFYEPSENVCGAQILVKSIYPDGLSRKATIGGILRVGDKYLCLTVAHVFVDHDQFQNLGTSNNSDFEFDIDGQSDTSEDDIDMIDTTSRGSRTPESAQSPDSEVTTMSVESSMLESSRVQQSQSPLSLTEFICDTPAAEGAATLLSDEHARAARPDMRIDLRQIRNASLITSTNGPRPALDYALIEINQPEFQTFNKFQSTRSQSTQMIYPERVATKRPDPNTKVMVILPSKGVVDGTMSGTPTFMQTPSSNSIQELWTVRLSRSLEKGDCGSWVMDLISGDVYGHIIAGSPESGVAYIVPAYQVIADVQERFNLDLQLSTKDMVTYSRGMSGSTLPGESPAEVDKLQASTSYHDYGDSPFSDRFSVSDHDALDVVSPLSSWSTPASDVGVIRHGFRDEQPANNLLSPETAAQTLFDIERDGDPRIAWLMYYDFVVTKTEAYYQLHPGYLPSVKYPSIRKSEKIIIAGGEKRHPCGVVGCTAKPFSRHYDLERHFVTIHQANKEKAGEEQDRKEQGNKEQGEKVLMNCDYKRCGHTAPFRKDHCREHYREYHTEDLIKRGQPKPSKPKNSKKKPETVEEFLAARIKNLNLNWWRCYKCIQRVHVNSDGYTCTTCNLACEPERVTFRENEARLRENGATRRENAPNTAKNSLGFDSAETYCVATGCGQCENTWLPDENDDNCWVSCPRCRSGVEDTMW